MIGLELAAAGLLAGLSVVLIALGGWLVTSFASTGGPGYFFVGNRANTTIMSLYAIGAFNSLTALLASTLGALVATVVGVTNFLFANWRGLLAGLLISAAGIGITTFNKPVSESATTIYNGVASPVLQQTVLPLLEIGRIAWGAAIPPWNVYVILMRFVIYSPATTLAACEIADLGPFLFSMSPASSWPSSSRSASGSTKASSWRSLISRRSPTLLPRWPTVSSGR